MGTINENGKDRITPMYRSGSAARLSGVPVETLRVWERRYNLVRPHRSAHGHREYSMEEIRHLSIIKQLVDRGNPIGAIAHLNDDELRAMLEQHPVTDVASGTNEDVSAGPGQLIRTFIVARHMSGSLADIDPLSHIIDVAGHSLSMQMALTQQALTADLLLIEISEINQIERDLIDTVKKHFNARGVLILYRFARHEAIRKLRSAGYLVSRIPTDMDELDSLCRLALPAGTSRPTRGKSVGTATDRVPAVLFDDQALAAVTTAANGIYCECPRHLVEILYMLGSFERYSRECENRNAADEKLHQQIYLATVQARFTMEQVLEKVARAEGLPLPARTVGEKAV